MHQRNVFRNKHANLSNILTFMSMYVSVWVVPDTLLNMNIMISVKKCSRLLVSYTGTVQICFTRTVWSCAAKCHHLVPAAAPRRIRLYLPTSRSAKTSWNIAMIHYSRDYVSSALYKYRYKWLRRHNMRRKNSHYAECAVQSSMHINALTTVTSLSLSLSLSLRRIGRYEYVG